MRVTVLVENTCNTNSLEAQHGLSLFIEHSGKTILFDMGQDDLFLRNAQSLGRDLFSVDLAIISHGHYDHGGGLEAFFKANSKAPVHISSTAFKSYHNKNYKYIGLDQSLAQNPRLRIVNEPTKLWEGATIYPAPCESALCSTNLYAKKNDQFVLDTFSHEQYLILEENNKRILLSGCSHRGITTILDEFKPEIFIGGMHLSHWDLGDDLKTLANTLKDSGIKLYTCHCTGVDQTKYMADAGVDVKYISCGTSILVE